MRYFSLPLMCAVVIALSGCEHLPSWAGGTPYIDPASQKDKDKRLAVVAEDTLLQAEVGTEDVVSDVPDQASNAEWISANDAMQYGHLGITGLTERESASAGVGAAYEQGLAPSPVIADGTVFAMDGQGAISARDAANLDTLRWENSALVEEDEPAIIGGGIAYSNDVLYASTGFGKLAAMDAKTGKKRWLVKLGVPVRGAPYVSGSVLVVVTVDNQTLAYDTASGRALWTHRGIRETAGYLSAISPVIADDIVLSAYSSGELAALRAESGSVMWGDTLINPERTRASDVFTGIDADPVVKDSIVYAISTSGSMVANALLNGRTLWQQKIDGHDTPWVAGNMVYLLTSKHQLVGLARATGKIVWATNLAETDDGRDVTPRLFGPVLAGNALIVVNNEGELLTFRPRDGKKLNTYDIVSDVAMAPIIAGGTLYMVTKDAEIVAYR